MLVGYARVSTSDQNLDMQLDALKDCERIFTDKVSGKYMSRPQFDKMCDMLREGDTVVVWKLDRLGRNANGVKDLIMEWAAKGIGFKSLNDPVDTTTAQGRFILTVFTALAEMEREVTRERIKTGLESAKARGRVGGRKRSLTPAEVVQARLLFYETDMTAAEVAARYGVSRPTLFRYFQAHRKI
jgi:DNA invertase Pin-like site-specific DNA recombinase